NLDDVIDKINITQRDKKIIIGIPIIIFILSISVIALNGLSFGTDLEGGTMVTLTNFTTDGNELQAELRDHFGTADITVKSPTNIGSGPTYVEIPSNIDSDDVQEYFGEKYPGTDVSFSMFDPTVTSQFKSEAMKAIILAFIAMSIIVFIVFRTPIPSLTVVLSAISDITITVALMSALGINLTLGTIAALLMVIGYSVDSNILLTTRLLKRRGELVPKVKNAMKTGFTMTITTLCAMLALYIVSSHPTLESISIVLIFALSIDLMNTWCLNTGILMWFLERQHTDQKKRRSGS
ncbi:MAG TPA: protein translocase subunit SecF, partial [Candidatus Methanofastidiosa archaeon]|nr:protein translocase subunit SecF [Candidatus Methanofastidiosa archaeon]